MGDRYGRSNINETSIGISVWNMGYRYGIWDIDMVIYPIDMVILDIGMEYGLMIWEMTVSIRSSPISIWDVWSHWTLAQGGHRHRCPGRVFTTCPLILYHGMTLSKQ